MKLKDFILKLKEFDQDLIVKIADWNENYREPDEGVAEEFVITYDSLVIGRSELAWYEKPWEEGK